MSKSTKCDHWNQKYFVKIKTNNTDHLVKMQYTSECTENRVLHETRKKNESKLSLCTCLFISKSKDVNQMMIHKAHSKCSVSAVIISSQCILLIVEICSPFQSLQSQQKKWDIYQIINNGHFWWPFFFLCYKHS